MNHIFCFNCGNKIQYNLSKPNFCTSCGTSLKTGESSASVAAPTKQIKNNKIKPLSEDETDAEFVPDIRKLEVETEQFGGSFTIGSLAGEKTQPDFKEKSTYDIDEFTK